jgi:hypothetical protein
MWNVNNQHALRMFLYHSYIADKIASLGVKTIVELSRDARKECWKLANEATDSQVTNTHAGFKPKELFKFDKQIININIGGAI